MERICGWCKKNLGHTCPLCESKNVTTGKVGQFGLGECGDCGYLFPLGEHGGTHGICDKCRAKVKAEHASFILLQESAA